jgi:ABC-2 type transport system ATP-binding protein
VPAHRDVEPFPLLTLTSVTRAFGRRTVLDGLSLDVPRAGVTGLVGPNGAGKTTVINLVAGLSRPTSGVIAWDGTPVGYPYPARIRRRLGLVPQETALYDELTVTENLRFAAELFGVADPQRRVGEILELVGLSERARDRVGVLSGGMRRRVAFGRALVHDPELLVLDEPTLAVDIDNRHAIWDHVRRLRSEGRTVLLSTNYLDEAEALCDVVVALRAGCLVAEGTTAALLGAAGRCVEIDCPDDAVDAVRRSVERLAPGARLDAHGAGLTVHLGSDVPAEPVASAALGTGHVRGVRVRAPDMVEVLEALGARSRG